ncbi:NF-kappa-B inhibitor alpha-like [Saccostrea echinata]|uniref:NF-kappa-B inhibitor alpha-like n=1 Tax=Saccostrea echinata TaxID=191078 RepID=UPI002A802249|nr:NF-kappa-B inhibitor alpha-like [Saccostrea echinata]
MELKASTMEDDMNYTSLEEDGCPLFFHKDAESGYFSGISNVSLKEDNLISSKQSLLEPPHEPRKTPESPGISQPLKQLNISSSSSTLAIQNTEFSKMVCRDKNGDTQLHTAIWQKKVQTVIYIIECIVSVDRGWLNFPNLKLQTPLHAATLQRMVEIVAFLMKENADIRICDDQGDTLLHIASREGYDDIVKTILNTGDRQVVISCIETHNYNGQTCLHLAANGLHFSVLRLLVSSGADVNVKDGMYNYTILHCVVQRHSSELLDYVLDIENISLDATSYAGETALQLAERQGFCDMSKVLREYTNNIRSKYL